ncbi:protein LTV1 homolog [Cyprinus carpio]|uniref:Protein LTV1 homolog n=1 Tax=Cyprinus carpio TaxID=7962 RepID=A0A9Q9YJ45_CYPCA|nr:protein LTV1 homolog [Cyprinus carpio]
MSHRKKKSFINKKNAVCFHLVHRSQKDRLAADETAPRHVLLPAAKVEVEKRKQDQCKFGVFFDDDYNYLQLLREASQPAELVSAPRLRRDAQQNLQKMKRMSASLYMQTASINLPSSVFTSEFEEEVGLLNKAAPVSGEIRICPAHASVLTNLQNRFYFRSYLISYSLDMFVDGSSFYEGDTRYTGWAVVEGKTGEVLAEGSLRGESAQIAELHALKAALNLALKLTAGTYSNLYNWPKLIQDPPKIRVSDKTRIPLDVLPKRGLTAKQVERMERINDSDLPRTSTQPRSQDESAEERRARKQAIKMERKERRLAKKANKLAFKQEKQMVNLRANVQGLKLS